MAEIFYFLEHADKFVYHYTKAETFADLILPNGNIRFKHVDRPGYCEMKLAIAEAKPAIFGHEEFKSFKETVNQPFAKWEMANAPRLKIDEPFELMLPKAANI